MKTHKHTCFFSHVPLYSSADHNNYNRRWAGLCYLFSKQLPLKHPHALLPDSVQNDAVSVNIFYHIQRTIFQQIDLHSVTYIQSPSPEHHIFYIFHPRADLSPVRRRHHGVANHSSHIVKRKMIFRLFLLACRY